MPPGSVNNCSLNSVEERSGLAMSWEGPKVFIYPDDHSGRFKGDLVSNIPDIKYFKVGQNGVADEFLLMACDGLWDVMDGDDAVRISKDLLFDKKLSAKDGVSQCVIFKCFSCITAFTHSYLMYTINLKAARLAELAKHLGSSDNITVILIRFYWEVGEI
jgi:serine/threonine protein phosphatase PrpC